jgi:gluconokinase
MPDDSRGSSTSVRLRAGKGLEMDGRTGKKAPAAAIVVMGVSGCGKSAIGEPVAKELSLPVLEGDDFHPEANVERMASGLPLHDEHRWGWLDAIGAAIAEHMRDGGGVVVSCSALKRKYRDRLRGCYPDILFVYLKIDRQTAHKRVGGRKGHFMPETLVESQFADLEPPDADEQAWTMDGTRTIDDLVAAIVASVRDGVAP